MLTAAHCKCSHIQVQVSLTKSLAAFGLWHFFSEYKPYSESLKGAHFDCLLLNLCIGCQNHFTRQDLEPDFNFSPLKFFWTASLTASGGISSQIERDGSLPVPLGESHSPATRSPQSRLTFSF